MASFTGTYYYTLDPKGRIIIPAPLREMLSAKYGLSKIYITNAAFDKCLHIYPEAEWALLKRRSRASRRPIKPCNISCGGSFRLQSLAKQTRTEG